MANYFIGVYGKNDTTPDLVKEHYDASIRYADYGDDMYKTLEECIRNALNTNKNIITISEDKTICDITQSIYSENNIKTIYVSSNPENIEKNTIYIGIDESIIDDTILEKLNDTCEIYITMKKIKQHGIANIMKMLNVNTDNIHIIYDIGIIEPTQCPSVERIRGQKQFLTFDELNSLIKECKKQVKHLDIIGFNAKFDDEKHIYTKITGNICRHIMKETYDLKEKALNIFSDDTRFLIYRNLIQEDCNDIGWKIVRFMTVQLMNTYIEKIGHNIMNIDYEDDNGYENNILIATTSINEQNEKSFYNAENIAECCLMPQEKVAMMFELMQIQP